MGYLNHPFEAAMRTEPHRFRADRVKGARRSPVRTEVGRVTATCPFGFPRAGRGHSRRHTLAWTCSGGVSRFTKFHSVPRRLRATDIGLVPTVLWRSVKDVAVSTARRFVGRRPRH